MMEGRASLLELQSGIMNKRRSEMSTPDATNIVLQSLSQDIAQLQERAEFHEMMIMQLVEALDSAGIISLTDPEAEEAEAEPKSLIIEP